VKLEHITESEFEKMYKSMTITMMAKKLNVSRTLIYIQASTFGLAKYQIPKEINNIIPGGLPHKRNCSCISCCGLEFK